MVTYTPVWNKYRPAIIRMLIDSSTGTQEYKLSGHEFVALSGNKKLGYTFTLQVAKSKAVNNIKESAVAKDLLATLQSSPKAAELTDASTFEISLDKQFVLRVTNITTPKPELNTETHGEISSIIS